MNWKKFSVFSVLLLMLIMPMLASVSAQSSVGTDVQSFMNKVNDVGKPIFKWLLGDTSTGEDFVVKILAFFLVMVIIYGIFNTVNLFGRKPEDFINKFKGKIKHIHLHDNDGNDDLHIPMGTGMINWEELVSLLKKYYDGTITLEIFSRDKDYVLLSKDKLRRLWDGLKQKKV
jgi:hypothetical protein